jgi:hypothetical protein
MARGLPGDDEASLLQGEGLLISHDVQFHWIDPGCGDFDGYLATFSAAKRRKVALKTACAGKRPGSRNASRRSDRPRRMAAAARALRRAPSKSSTITPLSRRPVSPIWRLLWAAAWSSSSLAIAGCRSPSRNLFSQRRSALGRYWGCRGNYHSLHFELCFYQGIAYCLQQGLRALRARRRRRAQAARGFTPTARAFGALDRRSGNARACWPASGAAGPGAGRLPRQAAEHLPFRRRSPRGKTEARLRRGRGRLGKAAGDFLAIAMQRQRPRDFLPSASSSVPAQPSSSRSSSRKL